jgi:hypothetical protein
VENTLAFHIVLSVSVERGYSQDRMSLAREVFSFTAHADREEALHRYVSELDADTKDGAALSLRRTFAVPVNVPLEMLGSGCPNRWISDRTSRLLNLQGGSSGEWARAAHNGLLKPLLGGDLEAAASELESAASDGASDRFGGLAALALKLAGAARRSAVHGFLDQDVSDVLEAAARRFGSAAWNGEDTMPHLKSLKSALSDAQALSKT